MVQIVTNSKYCTPTDAIVFALVAAFTAATVVNSLDLLTRIFVVFRRRSGRYFWSLIVAANGTLFHAIAFLLKFFVVEAPWELYTAMISCSWVAMVTGQSFVLWSRLHLIVRDKRILRACLIMICTNAFCLHIGVTVLTWFYFRPNVNDGDSFRFSIGEKVQVTIFALQEALLSLIYVRYAYILLEPADPKDTRRARQVLLHLIWVNVVVIFMDLAVMASQYANVYPIQCTLKPLVYSTKLKLEFVVLNELMLLANVKPGTYNRGQRDMDLPVPERPASFGCVGVSNMQDGPGQHGVEKVDDMSEDQGRLDTPGTLDEKSRSDFAELPAKFYTEPPEQWSMIVPPEIPSSRPATRPDGIDTRSVASDDMRPSSGGASRILSPNSPYRSMFRPRSSTSQGPITPPPTSSDIPDLPTGIDIASAVAVAGAGSEPNSISNLQNEPLPPPRGFPYSILARRSSEALPRWSSTLPARRPSSPALTGNRRHTVDPDVSVAAGARSNDTTPAGSRRPSSPHPGQPWGPSDAVTDPASTRKGDTTHLRTTSSRPLSRRIQSLRGRRPDSVSSTDDDRPASTSPSPSAGPAEASAHNSARNSATSSTLTAADIDFTAPQPYRPHEKRHSKDRPRSNAAAATTTTTITSTSDTASTTSSRPWSMWSSRDRSWSRRRGHRPAPPPRTHSSNDDNGNNTQPTIAAMAATVTSAAAGPAAAPAVHAAAPTSTDPVGDAVKAAGASGVSDSDERRKGRDVATTAANGKGKETEKEAEARQRIAAGVQWAALDVGQLELNGRTSGDRTRAEQ